MSDVKGCHLPEDLWYWPEKHVWVRGPESDGTVVVGMTDVAQSLAGKIIVVNLKSPGRTLAQGKSAGTLESGKWVGSIPTPIAGEIVAVNEALKSAPHLVNEDPYGQGWLIRVRPTDWADGSKSLVFGPDGVEAYRRRLDEEHIQCTH
ncbi:MAG: glycine cleavage system protein GcvH [Firmicutes bacterium]|nr:glycine cleavage system protein GcvH [Bacillota bacterium]